MKKGILLIYTHVLVGMVFLALCVSCNFVFADGEIFELERVDEAYWEEYLDKHEFQFYRDEVLHKTFKTFAVNENGEFAILIMEGSHSGYVNVYDESGNFEYALFLKNEDGSKVTVTWEDGNVGVFFARAHALFLFDDDGQCVGIFDVLGEGYASYLEKHNCKNDKVYYARGTWALLSINNTLTLVESAGEEQIIYSAKATSSWMSAVILIIVIAVVISVVLYIKHKGKRMRR